MRTIVDCLDSWAAKQPEDRLFSFVDAYGKEEASYSFREFQARTRSLAEQLQDRVGLAYGDRVVLAYPPGLELLAALFACARIGAIPAPVSAPTAVRASAGVANVGRVAEDCDATAILTSHEGLNVLSAISASQQAAPSRASNSAQQEHNWIATDTLQTQTTALCIDNPHPVLYLQYTSGSTGNPRGVLVTHTNVLANAASVADGVGPGVSWLPQFHDMGLIGYGLFPVVHGVAVSIMSPSDFLRRPATWLQTISRVRAAYASAPNFGFEYCLRADKLDLRQLDGVDLSSLRVLMNASEPVQYATYRRFLARFAPYGLSPDCLVMAYGLAENTLAVTHRGRRFFAADRAQLRAGAAVSPSTSGTVDERIQLASCGWPVPGVGVRVVDPVSREVLPDRRVGEVWVSGTSVCAGYWGRPRLTQGVFANALDGGTQNYLRTGDLGFLDRGELFVCGRLKDLVIRRGVNYYPEDIEAAVAGASEMLRPGGVAAFNGDVGDDTLVIVAELRRPGEIPDVREIARAVRAQSHVEPDVIVLARPRAIARTTSGKIARQVTRELYLTGRLAAVTTYQVPRLAVDVTATRTARDRILSRISGSLGSRGAETTLEELGLDSLALVDMALDLERLFAGAATQELISELDVPLLSSMTVAEFRALVDAPAGAQPDQPEQWRAHLRGLRRTRAAHVHSKMRADARLGPGPCAPAKFRGRPIRTVLMTGATGFLGPFLLARLLATTPYRYLVLVRAQNSNEGWQRVWQSLSDAGLLFGELARQARERVRILPGDLAQVRLALSSGLWHRLGRDVDAIVHNAAAVNYVQSYDALRPHNVEGTRTLLNLARSVQPKPFHFVSSTFIFGWSQKRLLVESDNNDEMAALDFGYAQTKWVAEQLVLSAAHSGLPVQIYRPALLGPSSLGVGSPDDVALRLLAFMAEEGIAIDCTNQVSILPVDIAAADIASMVAAEDLAYGVVHLTADHYYTMPDITRLMQRDYGFDFRYLPLRQFVREMNRCCTRESPMYPLLDFVNRAAEKFGDMELKRYRNARYQKARSQLGLQTKGRNVSDVVANLVRCLRRNGMVGGAPVGPSPARSALASPCDPSAPAGESTAGARLPQNR